MKCEICRATGRIQTLTPREKRLAEALNALRTAVKSLVDSGDAGAWNPEEVMDLSERILREDCGYTEI